MGKAPAILAPDRDAHFLRCLPVTLFGRIVKINDPGVSNAGFCFIFGNVVHFCEGLVNAFALRGHCIKVL